MDDERIRMGVVLPTGRSQWGGADPRELITLARHAEELGFDSIWAGDTLLRPVIEPLTMLAAAAAVTSTITLGTAVVLPALRRPVQAAQAIASLDQLSGGRLVVTVGAGFPGRSEAEYAASGVPWAGRAARLDDTVALWRHLWATEGPTSFPGVGGIPSGFPTARAGGPPVWLGGATPKALARIARGYDGWLPYPPDPETYRAGLAVIEEAAVPAKKITPALFVTLLVTDDEPRAALDTYTRATYRLPLETVEKIQVFIAGTADRVAADLARYTAAGARHLVCRVGVLSLEQHRTQLALISALKT